jgi:hypothetical protein
MGSMGEGMGMNEYQWHDLVGNVGVFFILASYLLLQLEKIDVSSLWYSAVNGLGAAMVIFSLLYEFNLSAFLIESVWLLISIFGIGRQLLITNNPTKPA